MDILKLGDFIEIECSSCKRTIKRKKYQVLRAIKLGAINAYCDHECQMKEIRNPQIVNCKQCHKPNKFHLYQVKRGKNLFCDSHCAAVYNNAHKTKGYRRAKLEVYLESRLKEIYPNLEIHFNRKDAINSELDIYIPGLLLAFELNGIFHYEPIYGLDKLKNVQNNDNRKFQACIERNIELCIIDTSREKHFKERWGIQYLGIIVKIINNKLGQPMPFL